MSKVSAIIKPKVTLNEEGFEVEEELKPLITVDDTLNNLYYPKYQKKMKKGDQEAEEAEGFKLNAKDMQEFQDIVEASIGI